MQENKNGTLADTWPTHGGIRIILFYIHFFIPYDLDLFSRLFLPPRLIYMGMKKSSTSECVQSAIT